MMLLGRFTGGYIGFDSSSSVEIQDYDFYTSQQRYGFKMGFCKYFAGTSFLVYTYSKF